MNPRPKSGRPSKECPGRGAINTDTDRCAERLSPGYVGLRCPRCGKETGTIPMVVLRK